MAASTPSPDAYAFVTYSRKDIEIARRFVEEIRQRGFRAVWDQDLKAGEEWMVWLKEQISGCSALIVLISPTSMESEWVLADVKQAAEQQKYIIPVRIAPVDYSTLPAPLPSLQIVTLIRDVYEPTTWNAGINAVVEALTALIPVVAETPPVPVTPQQRVEEVRRQIAMTVAAQALSDKPISTAGEDKLGFKVYADALTDFILHPKTTRPLTIAVDAAWGSGKTSLMRMIGEGINTKNPQVLTVWFNAWKYDKEEALWAALALAITRAVKDLPAFNKRQVDFKLWRQQFNLAALWRDVRNRMAYYVVVALFALLVLVIFGLALGQGVLTAFQQALVLVLTGGGGLLSLISIGRQFVKSINDFLEIKIENYMRRPNYGDRIGFIAEFEKDFETLANTVTDNGRQPLVVFIDDLDRCSPGRAVEVIEAVNLFLDQPNCVFVIGMDSKSVAASVEVRYEKMKDYYEREYGGEVSFGQRFLEKMVQITFRFPILDTETIMSLFEARAVSATNALPPPRQASSQGQTVSPHPAGNVIVQQTTNLPQKPVETVAIDFDTNEEVSKAISEIVPFLDFNPRRVKRFVNVFRLQTYIVNRLKMFEEGTIRLDWLAIWTVIAMLFPEYVDAISNDPTTDDSVLQALDTYRQQASELNPKDRLDVRVAIRGNLSTPQQQRFFDSPLLLELMKKTQGMSDDQIRRYTRLVRTVGAVNISTAENAPPEQSEVEQKAPTKAKK